MESDKDMEALRDAFGVCWTGSRNGIGTPRTTLQGVESFVVPRDMVIISPQFTLSKLHTFFW